MTTEQRKIHIANPYARKPENPLPNSSGAIVTAPGFTLSTETYATEASRANKPCFDPVLHQLETLYSTTTTDASIFVAKEGDSENVVVATENVVPTRLSFEPVEGSRVPKKIPGQAGQNVPGVAVLGKAKSTIECQANSIQIFELWLGEMVDLPNKFGDLTAAHVEGEGLNDLVWAFGLAIVSIPIPIKPTRGFLPQDNAKSKKQMGWSSLKNHAQNVKNALRDRFPEHPWWPKSKSDNPESWKELIAAMETEFKRNMLTKWSKTPELEWGCQKTKPLYTSRFFGDRVRGAGSGDLEFDEWFGDRGNCKEQGIDYGVGRHPRLTTDLRTIMRVQFLSAHPLNPMSYIHGFRTILSWVACCRGGEIANSKWHEAEDLPNWQAIGIVKHQQKNLLNKGQLIVVPMHADCFWLCPLFWMGCYIFLGEGLYRTQQQVIEGKGDCIFPDDYRRSSSAVSQSIGNNLKKFVHQSASRDLKDSVTQRSGKVPLTKYHAIQDLDC